PGRVGDVQGAVQSCRAADAQLIELACRGGATDLDVENSGGALGIVAIDGEKPGASTTTRIHLTRVEDVGVHGRGAGKSSTIQVNGAGSAGRAEGGAGHELQNSAAGDRQVPGSGPGCIGGRVARCGA